MLIPVSEAVKTKMDMGVGIGSAALIAFKSVPWAELAAFLACVYWIVRIWQRRKK